MLKYKAREWKKGNRELRRPYEEEKEEEEGMEESIKKLRGMEGQRGEERGMMTREKMGIRRDREI